jgi:arsenate reductase
MKTVLFACVHNAGRSQMAAAWFNQLADPTKAKAISAGTAPGDRVHPEVAEVMREVGIELGQTRPQFLSDELASKADWLITMGCGEACPVVPGIARDDWPLEDPKQKPIERVREIRSEVQARVAAFVQRNGWTRAPQPMITPAYLRLMATYNHAMNERIYALAAELTDEQRKRDLGAFFGSIHRTLNHILWADARAVRKFTDGPIPPADVNHEMHADFAELRKLRASVDDGFLKAAAQLKQEDLETWTTVTSVATGRTRTWPVGAMLVHIFNHQTHHRGQLTTMLRQLGKDVGVTDIPWLEIDYGF